MPTYTYRCGNCDHRFDLVQGFNDPDPIFCPDCGFENKLKRVYKPVGVVFKGSGFYATDNKSSAVRAKNGNNPSENGSSPDSKSDKKSDSKENTSKKVETSKKESSSSKK
jgi:putative FmdB family regulatory protein